MWFLLLAAVLLAPCVGIGLAVTVNVTLATTVHAAVMVTAWGFMIQAGGAVAQTWWRWHRGLQYAGVVVSTVALGVIL